MNRCHQCHDKLIHSLNAVHVCEDPETEMKISMFHLNSNQLNADKWLYYWKIMIVLSWYAVKIFIGISFPISMDIWFLILFDSSYISKLKKKKKIVLILHTFWFVNVCDTRIIFLFPRRKSLATSIATATAPK